MIRQPIESELEAYIHYVCLKCNLEIPTYVSDLKTDADCAESLLRKRHRQIVFDQRRFVMRLQ